MSNQPLAERLRPKTLDGYIGQKHLVGEGAVIHEAVLNQFDFNEILISHHGLREGFLLFCPRQSSAAVGSALPKPSCASPVEMVAGVPDVPFRRAC